MTTALGICGSAWKRGSTTTLLQEVLNTIGVDSELIWLSPSIHKFDDELIYSGLSAE